MGLFSWDGPEDKASKELLNLVNEMGLHKEFMISHITTIEGILSKMLKLYELQNSEINELRQDLANISVNKDINTDLCDNTKTVIKSPKGLLSGNTRTYYAAVLAPLLKKLDINVSPRITIQNKSVDFMICEPDDLEILAAVKLIDNNDDGTTEKILSDAGIKYITVNRDDPAGRVVEVMREQVKSAVAEVRAKKAEE